MNPDKKALDKYYEHLQYLKSITEASKGQSFATSDTQSRIEKARKNYAFFVKTYFPHLAKSDCGKFQIDAAKYLKNNPKARAVFEWARGHAKSSHLSLMIPLWLKCQEISEPIIMVLVSKSQDAAKRLLSDIQAELEANELYIHDFGQQKTNGLWTDGEFVTEDGSMFVALGRGQSPRGIKKKGIRVNYISIDDIDDDEMVRNPRRVDETVKWCMSALLGTMAMGRGRFVLVGNRIGQKSVLSEIAERPHFYHTVVNALDKNGDPSWKENYTKAEIQSLREEMGELLFQKEYMNNPVIEGAVFEKKYIKYGKILKIKDYRAIVCYTDPSFKDTSKNDYKATMLVGLTKQGEYHVLKAFADQTKVSTMVEWHYDIQAFIGEGSCRYFMEANFIQDSLLDEFKKEGEKRGLQIPVLGDRRKKPDKFARIEALQPLFERGLIIFNDNEKDSQGIQVLVNQLLGFQRGSRINDDAPDALEGAIWILSNLERKVNNRYVTPPKIRRRW
jgi:predicted phage terminase large subunit-like protein